MKMMPKIYDDATMQLVWDMIRVEKKLLKQVAAELCTTADKIDQIYAAAYRRYGCNQYQNRANQSAKKSIKQDPPKKQIQRPPAVYSNQGWEEYLSK